MCCREKIIVILYIFSCFSKIPTYQEDRNNFSLLTLFDSILNREKNILILIKNRRDDVYSKIV